MTDSRKSDPEPIRSIEPLERRLHKLAADKSRLQLVVHMITKLGRASTLSEVIETGIQTVNEVIGSLNTILYVCMGREFRRVDIFGHEAVVDTIDDRMAKEAFESGEPRMLVSDYGQTRMTFESIESHAFTFAYPLIVHARSIGVVKVIDTAYNLAGIKENQSLFFDYFAHMLDNGVRNSRRLEEANRRLERLNRRLEEIVTERTAALRQSQEQYRLLVENQTDLLVKTDLKGTLQFVSPSYCRMFGTRESSMIGRDFLTVGCSTESATGVTSSIPWESLEASPHHVYIERRVESGSGSRLLGWNGTAVLDDQQQPEAVIWVGRDITEQRETEVQLEQARRMETIGTLSGGVAHDFNNILHVILGNATVALEGTPSDTMLRESLGDIVEAAEQGAQIVQRLLTFCRKDQVSRRPVDAASVLRGAVESLRKTVRSTVEIRATFPDAPLIILSEKTQIQQILINLCTNAAEAMETTTTDSYIDISVGRVRLDRACVTDTGAVPPGDYLELRVTDTGRGIAPEIMDRLFDPYFTTKSRDRGSGMGLPVVHGIVEGHGGGISVRSTLGKGTTFTIHLPIATHLPLPSVEPEA